MNENQIQEAPDNVVPLAKARPVVDRRVQKLMLKEQKRRDDRKAELLKGGIKEEMIEQILAQEEYQRLPIDQKVRHLEQTINYTQRLYNETIKNLASEMVALRQNQEEIADAFDINARAWSQLLRTVNVSDEIQKQVLEEATKQFMDEKMAAMKAHADAIAKKEAPKTDTEKASIEAEISKANAETKGIVTA